MKDNDIISSMVKGRECCRQLVQTYESVHTKTANSEPISNADLNLLTRADKVVTKMLACIQGIPSKPEYSMEDDCNKVYAARLISEITELLEKALILEREVRNTTESKPTDRKQTITPSLRALRGYAA